MNKHFILLACIVLVLGMVSACFPPESQYPVVGQTVVPATPQPVAPDVRATATVEPSPPQLTPSPETPEDAADIVVLLPDSSPFDRWEAQDRQFFEEAFDAAGVTYAIMNAGGDAQLQEVQAEQAIANGAAVLLLTSVENRSGSTIIELAHQSSVKVIDYARLTTGGPAADLYVGFDDVATGRLMGEILEPVIDGLEADPKRVVHLNGAPNDESSAFMREGFLLVASPHYDAADWELADDQAVPDWDIQQAAAVFEEILAVSGGDVDATFAASDGLADAVVKVLQDHGLDPMPLSGQGATVSGIQNILSGWQTMTVYKPVNLEVGAAALAAIALFNGEEVGGLTGDMLNNGVSDVPFIKLTPQAVTADTIADTVIADGFRTWEEICAGDFAQYCPENR